MQAGRPAGRPASQPPTHQCNPRLAEAQQALLPRQPVDALHQGLQVPVVLVGQDLGGGLQAEEQGQGQGQGQAGQEQAGWAGAGRRAGQACRRAGQAASGK
jgi:hypothetical protein